jgi:hypothetical protein
MVSPEVDGSVMHSESGSSTLQGQTTGGRDGAAGGENSAITQEHMEGKDHDTSTCAVDRSFSQEGSGLTPSACEGLPNAEDAAWKSPLPESKGDSGAPREEAQTARQQAAAPASGVSVREGWLGVPSTTLLCHACLVSGPCLGGCLGPAPWSGQGRGCQPPSPYSHSLSLWLMVTLKSLD